MEGTSIGIPMGLFRLGNLRGVNHGIWRSEFEGKSIGIQMGIPRICNLGGMNVIENLGIPMGIGESVTLGVGRAVSGGMNLRENL